MIGMLQIITYLLAFYLVMKGVEIFQIGLSSNRENRIAPITIGVLAFLACLGAAIAFAYFQDEQAATTSKAFPGPAQMR